MRTTGYMQNFYEVLKIKRTLEGPKLKCSIKIYLKEICYKDELAWIRAQC
jgi:hypothetical protein